MPEPERLIQRHAGQPGLSGALLFALVAERLTQFYDHGHWPEEGRMRQLALEWLSRAAVKIDSPWLRELVSASGEIAQETSGKLSRETGLLATHEMIEALDPNYRSPLAQTMMDQCVGWVENLSRGCDRREGDTQ